VTETRTLELAAGERGIMVARLPTGWVRVDSTVHEALRTLWDCSFDENVGDGQSRKREAVCAAGDHGRLVRCVVESMSVTCAARESPVDSRLSACDGGAYIVGAKGMILRSDTSELFKVVEQRPVTGSDLFAIATNRSGVLARDATPIDDVIAVGAHGTIVCLTPTAPPSSFSLAHVGDLFGIDTEGLDYFAVGSGGLILHAVIKALLPISKEI
jgi:hypothetical protein